MKLYVKTLIGTKFAIFAQSNDSVQTLKGKIQDQQGIPSDWQKLIVQGRQLQDCKSVSDCNLQNQQTIYVVLRLSGGGQGYQFDFNSMEKKVQLPFGEGPDYRKVAPGLTMFAICQTESCKAFNQEVCVQKGFGTLNIAKQIYKCLCPACKKPTRESNNIGYYKTIIKIQGRYSDGKFIERQELQAEGKFRTFKNGDGDIRSWNYLEIITTQLK